jgi:hypothetical protein
MINNATDEQLLAVVNGFAALVACDCQYITQIRLKLVWLAVLLNQQAYTHFPKAFFEMLLYLNGLDVHLAY